MTARVAAGSLTLAVALAVAAVTAAAETAAPLVLRGGEVVAAGGPPLVLRGQGPAPAIRAPAAPEAMAVVLAGERLWLVDQEGGRIVACRLEQGAMVDSLRVRCAGRDGRPWH